ncbi:MAG: hypothetical protein WCL14_10375 [Bacteroidota bacterium]
MFTSRIMDSPAIRCSRCIPIADTKQRLQRIAGRRWDEKQA